MDLWCQWQCQGWFWYNFCDALLLLIARIDACEASRSRRFVQLPSSSLIGNPLRSTGSSLVKEVKLKIKSPEQGSSYPDGLAVWLASKVGHFLLQQAAAASATAVFTYIRFIWHWIFLKFHWSEAIRVDIEDFMAGQMCFPIHLHQYCKLTPSWWSSVVKYS